MECFQCISFKSATTIPFQQCIFHYLKPYSNSTLQNRIKVNSLLKYIYIYILLVHIENDFEWRHFSPAQLFGWNYAKIAACCCWSLVLDSVFFPPPLAGVYFAYCIAALTCAPFNNEMSTWVPNMQCIPNAVVVLCHALTWHKLVRCCTFGANI